MSAKNFITPQYRQPLNVLDYVCIDYTRLHYFIVYLVIF